MTTTKINERSSTTYLSKIDSKSVNGNDNANDGSNAGSDVHTARDVSITGVLRHSHSVILGFLLLLLMMLQTLANAFPIRWLLQANSCQDQVTLSSSS